MQCHGAIGKRFLIHVPVFDVDAFCLANKHLMNSMVVPSQSVTLQHLLQFLPLSSPSSWLCIMATESACSAVMQIIPQQEWDEGTVSASCKSKPSRESTMSKLQLSVGCHLKRPFLVPSILLLSNQTITVTECNSLKRFVHVLWIYEAPRLVFGWRTGHTEIFTAFLSLTRRRKVTYLPCLWRSS